MILKIAFLFVLILTFVSCKKGTIEPINTPYNLEQPSHFPKMVIPDDNPLTVAGVDLGRRLFYEKRLSGDNSLSCGGCHSPKESFSDPNKFSRGIDGKLGRRNSMALINLGYQKFFFWDGRSKSLEEQILQPVQDPVEMHQSWTNTVIKIKADANYRKAFYVAFGTDQVDSTLVSKALAQFLRTMVSGFSKYDVMYKQANNLSLTAKEQGLSAKITNEDWAGYDLFKSLNGGDCFHCHNGPLMHLELFSNNGLDNTFLDLGRGEVTKSPSDYGKFKVPSLRNVALTGPYMHDGRFQTLDEVIEHYSSGIKISSTISPLIEFANQGGVQLDAFEKGLIKKFLLTLTDEEFINNPKFAPPI